MKIVLNWVNRNTGEEGTRVFRSDQPITSVEGLTPIATLPQGANTYTDEDVVQGQYYHYRLEVFNGDQKFLGLSVPVLAMGTTGPGPMEILRGDWERGFFGEVTPDEFIDHNELVLLCGMSTIGANVAGSISWIKCARKGKVLFYPKSQIRTTVSWKQLYEKGLVFGRDDIGPFPTITGVTPTNQNTIVEIKGFRYRVRLMKALSDGVNSSAAAAGAPTADSEWNDLVLTLLTTITSDQTWGNLANYAEAALTVTNNVGIRQELNDALTHAFYRQTLTLSVAGITAANASYFWLPVLELID